MKSLRGLRVLITGAARGIGEASARRLAARGACLALVGMEPERLQELAIELGPEHAWAECNVTNYDHLKAAVVRTASELGGLDVVVANAGIANNGTVAANPARALAKTIEVNLIGVIHTVSATLPALTESKGYYLLVCSASAIAPMPSMAAYTASKAGVENFGKAFRLEVAYRGIDVGLIYPSWIDTDLVRDQQHELRSFNDMLRSLPWPFNYVTPLGTCADAVVDAIAHRKSTQYVPPALGPIAAARSAIMGPAWEMIVKRRARNAIPKAEQEVEALGRPFGEHSMGAILLEREKQE